MRRLAGGICDRGSTSRDAGAPPPADARNVKGRKDDKGVISATTLSPEGVIGANTLSPEGRRGARWRPRLRALPPPAAGGDCGGRRDDDEQQCQEERYWHRPSALAITAIWHFEQSRGMIPPNHRQREA